MAKVKSKYVCQSCGYETAGYLGKCPECGSWGSFVEEVFGSKSAAGGNQEDLLPDMNPPKRLSEIKMEKLRCF